jgi:hypothetical protein
MAVPRPRRPSYGRRLSEGVGVSLMRGVDVDPYGFAMTGGVISSDRRRQLRP